MAMRVGALVLAATVTASATAGTASADIIDPPALLETCLLRGDQAFETALNTGLPLDHDTVLPFYRAATWAADRCTAMAVDLCNLSDDIGTCRRDLATHAEALAVAIMDRVPEALETGRFSDGIYGRIVSKRFPSALDPTPCDHATAPLAPGMCEVGISYLRLDYAYQAWRMGRRHGAMDLEGHNPLPREAVPWEN